MLENTFTRRWFLGALTSMVLLGVAARQARAATLVPSNTLFPGNTLFPSN